MESLPQTTYDKPKRRKSNSRNLIALKKESLNINPIAPNLLTQPDDLAAVIEGYFTKCVNLEEPPTMTGLAMHLGMTRKELIDYQAANNTIQLIINRAKQIVVAHVEKLLISGLPPGGFSLWLRNNDNWVEKTEVTTTHITRAKILDALEYKEDPDNPDTYEPAE